MSKDRFDELERFAPLFEPPEPSVEEFLRRRERRRRNQRIAAAIVGIVVFVVPVALFAVLSSGRGDEGTRPGQGATMPADEVPTAAPGPVSGPYFLDLRTGESTPLAENLTGAPEVLAYVPSPDGAMVAYGTCSGDFCSDTDVMTVANLDGTDPRTLQAPEGLNISAARWSPDGTKLVYQERMGGFRGRAPDVGNLFVEDLDSGARTQVTDLELTEAQWYFLFPRFSPDGQRVIFHLPRTSGQDTKFDVWSVPVTGGDPTLVLRNASFPVVFPDGKTIAFVSGASDFSGQNISIADAEGSRRTLVEAKDSIWWPAVSPDGARIAYVDGDAIYVVDVSTGETSQVGEGGSVEWLDDDTLIVTP